MKKNEILQLAQLLDLTSTLAKDYASVFERTKNPALKELLNQLAPNIISTKLILKEFLDRETAVNHN